MKKTVLVGAIGVGLLLAAAPTAAAYSRADSAIIRDFMRQHPAGYKVVAVAHSDWTRDVGVWFVRTGAAGGYAVVGTAFYNHGRHVRPKPNDAFFAGGRPLYTVSFTGSGTYSKVESSPSGEGGSTSTTQSAQFQWTAAWSGKKAFRLYEDPYNSNQASLSGTTSYSGTDNNSCTGSLTANGSATLDPQVGRGGVWTFSFYLGLPAGSSPDSNCNFTPQNPNTEEDLITLAAPYRPEAIQTRGVDKWNETYSPFTISPAVHHHVHTGPSADNPGYNSDEDLAGTGTAHFTPTGLASY